MKTKIKKDSLEFEDPILEQKIKLKIEEISSDNVAVRVNLPEEKNFFRGINFSEKVRLEKLRDGQWVKILRAKFGAGAEELFGVTEINEESELEARDIRIIAAVESLLKGSPRTVKVKKLQITRAVLKL